MALMALSHERDSMVFVPTINTVSTRISTSHPWRPRTVQVPACRRAELGEGQRWGRAKPSVTATASRLFATASIAPLTFSVPRFYPTSTTQISQKRLSSQHHGGYQSSERCGLAEEGGDQEGGARFVGLEGSGTFWSSSCVLLS